MELGWGGFDRAKLDMLILIRIPFSFHVFTQLSVLCLVALLPRQAESRCVWVWHVFSCRYLIFISQFMMATLDRGQSPARHTKVMDSYLGPLKKDRPQKNRNIRSCDDEATSLKPSSVGRGGAEDTQTNPSCKVTEKIFQEIHINVGMANCDK